MHIKAVPDAVAISANDAQSSTRYFAMAAIFWSQTSQSTRCSLHQALTECPAEFFTRADGEPSTTLYEMTNPNR